ncbi:tyrosine-type recombinase/integrase [Candidatus Poribacteria bacterium]
MSDQISKKTEDYLERFGGYLQSVGMAQNTVESYGRDVKQFLKFLEAEGANIRDVDEEVLLRFLQKLTERELTSATKRRMMEGLKTFFRAMRKVGQVDANPFTDFQDMPKVKDNNMRVLTEMEYRALRDVVRSSRRKSSIRDYAILELALQTGLRRAEICSLTMEDIEFSTKITVGHIRVRESKGGRERTVTLNHVAEKSLREYLAMRPEDTDYQEIFLNNRLKPCAPVVISAIFKKYMEKAGIHGASFHSLRHTFATHSLKNDTNIIVVQEALGHKSLTTTQKYTHFLREIMDKQLTQNSL